MKVHRKRLIFIIHSLSVSGGTHDAEGFTRFHRYLQSLRVQRDSALQGLRSKLEGEDDTLMMSASKTTAAGAPTSEFGLLGATDLGACTAPPICYLITAGTSFTGPS